MPFCAFYLNLCEFCRLQPTKLTNRHLEQLSVASAVESKPVFAYNSYIVNVCVCASCALRQP